MDAQEIRAAALLAAARGAVNPGIVIENARRFAVWIESGHDIGATPVKVPAKTDELAATGLCRDDCAFLDGRGFCTCGGQPELMLKPRTEEQ